MHRVTRRENGVIVSPQQKRLSVGFGPTASIQIHAAETPTNVTSRKNAETTYYGMTPNMGKADEPVVASPTGSRMSLHENLLLRILTTPSDRALFRQHSSDDAVFSQRTADDSFDSCLSGTNTPVLQLLNHSPDDMRCNTPPVSDEGVINRHLQLLYRDLNSPSATARMRALRALRSPGKGKAYGNFDISYAEQDIITAEERIEPEKRNIQDILREVCVFVEVRSGTDNRSDGIKEHIASLGAKVNERLLKDTTHVIFKDGLLSTYQKAKKMNIPVVSILWIEACKRHMCLMNPEDFKISNAERYENPDLFKRIRRQKSMQPGAEETAGQKKRLAAAAKSNPVVSPPSKLPVLHRISKDDRLERMLNEFEAENQISRDNLGPVDEYDEMLQAAPMRMLERFRSTPTAQDSPAAAETHPTQPADDDIYVTPTGVKDSLRDLDTATRRTLFSGSNSGSRPSHGGAAPSRSRRKTILFTPQMTNVQEETVAPNRPTEPSLRNRRRTIVAVDGKPSAASDAERSRVVDGSVSSSTPAPTSTIRTRRSSMMMAAAMEQQQSSPRKVSPNRENTEQSIVSVADSSASITRTTRRKTIVASKENISPSMLRTPGRVDETKEMPSTNKRKRRKTIAFENEENTPPTGAKTRNLGVTGSKTRAILSRGTIHTTKDMEVSNVQQSALVNEPAAELTRMNSKGSEMSVASSPLDERTGAAGRHKPLLPPPANSAQEIITISEERGNTNRSSVMSISSASIYSGRRRTLFTPSDSTFMEPLEISETPPEPESSIQLSHTDGISIVSRPNPTSSSTPKVAHESVNHGRVAAPLSARRKTLLEEYEESLVFSSTRAPDRRRRTVFDISMDIMDQRLSEINRQAAAMKGQSTASSAGQRREQDCSDSLVAEGAAKTSAHSGNLVSQPPAGQQQQSLDAFFRKAVKSGEKSDKPTAAASSASATEEATTAPRKRKLFNTQTTEEVVPVPRPTTAKPPAKRQSLAVGTNEAAAAAATAAANKRRTTALFETQKVRQQYPVGRGLPTMASQYVPNQQQHTQQVRQHLATTNLHTEQSAFVKEAITQLDGFVIEADVTDNTTHLVTLEPRRTINLLRALIRGLWIVRYEWIVESYRARRWLPEEQFEVRDFSPTVQFNRSERQAFGSQYRNDLLADYGPFWIAPRCAVPARQLRELVLLCHGRVTGNRSKAKYLVAERDDESLDHHRETVAADGQLRVAVQWILDSITANKVKKLTTKYRV